MIRAHREGDIRRLGQETELLCLHCIHNIDSSESHISKQFVYTISSILFWFILHAYIAVNTDKLTPQMVQMDGVFDVDVDDPSLYSRALYCGRPFSSLPETVSQEWGFFVCMTTRILCYLSECGMNKRMLHAHIPLLWMIVPLQALTEFVRTKEKSERQLWLKLFAWFILFVFPPFHWHFRIPTLSCTN